MAEHDDETAPMLPGLDDAGATGNGMARAAAAYVATLREQGLIKPHHVLTVQLVHDLAAAIGKAALKGQAAAMALASKELREAMDRLPEPQAQGDAFDQLLQELRESSTEGSNP